MECEKFVFRDLTESQFEIYRHDENAISDMLSSGQISPKTYFLLRKLLFQVWWPEDYLNHPVLLRKL